MFTIDNFMEGLENFMPSYIQIAHDESCIAFSLVQRIDNSSEAIGQIPLDEIQDILSSIKQSASFNEYILHSKTSFEVPVKISGNLRQYRQFDSETYRVEEHEYNLLMSKASNDYLFALMCFLSSNDDIKLDIPILNSHMRNKIKFESIEDLGDFFRIYTAKMVLPAEFSLGEFKRILQSYLFNIAYNHNIFFQVDDFTREPRIFRRRMNRTGQLFPYKSYNSQLVIYYYQGISTDIPFVQYLSFYHVAEFFFQTIAEQNAFDEIENLITRPSFSPYKKEDIRNFYNKLKKTMKEQRDDGIWNEKQGLLLCLNKYISSIDDLKRSINDIDASAIDYYQNNDVSFADGAKSISFNDAPESTFTVIRNRVYSVRNAIVHSKDGESSRYEPFKHDKELSKEIPLIRAIAEEIIINSAKSIEIKQRS